jgi:ribonuclease HII
VTVSLVHERALWDAGAVTVAGIDEVGRGALAGPVSVGVVVLTVCEAWPEGLADSKQLTRWQREAMCPTRAHLGIARAVGHASPGEIDDVGIVAALRRAALRALANVGPVDAILLDGTHDWLTARPTLLEPDPEETAPVTMVVKGDALCASVAAGSVLAKVDRDGLMREAHVAHPAYGWDGNKGYGAAAHLEAIRRYGATELHRRSWSLPAQEAS